MKEVAGQQAAGLRAQDCPPGGARVLRAGLRRVRRIRRTSEKLACADAA
jgi:hypothetical protein